MSSSKGPLKIFQFLRLNWYLALRAILHTWVRTRLLPEPISRCGIDPDQPICYIMDTYALSSLLVLDKVCQDNKLRRPLHPIEGAGELEGRAWAALRRLSGVFVRHYSNRRSPTMIKNLAEYALDNPEFEVQLIPVSILIGRAPNKESSLTKLVFTEGWDMAGRMRRLFSTFVNGRNTFVYIGTPFSLRKLVDEKSDDKIAVRKIYRLARTQLRQRREKSIGPDLSHRRTLLKEIIGSERVQAVITSRAQAEKTGIQQLQSEAEGALKEIAANYSYSVIRFCAMVLPWIWNKIYNGVELNHFKDFEHNSSGKEIVYVPCHRSHIDYLLMSYLLYQQDHVPPHIAAGVNLNLPGLGPFLRRAGAFYMRRSFRDDPLYAAVFDEYLATILAQGVSIEYFIEGGRSRTGRLLPPKLGMLQMTVLAYLRAPKKPVIFQPVYIGYEQLVEGSSYNSELGGKEKKKESLTDLFGAFKIFRKNHGKVHVNFGEPLELDSLLYAHDKDWKNVEFDDRPDWLPALAEQLSTSIMTNINDAADVNPVNLLALCLLATAKHAMPRQELIFQLELCLNILRSSPSSDKLTITGLSAEEIIKYGQELDVIEEREHTLGNIISVPDNKAVLLTYFRNNISHLFAVPSFIASCFLVRNEISKTRMQRLFALIYPYLQKELFLPWSDKEVKKILFAHIEVFQSLNLITGGRILKRTSGGTQAAASLGLLGRGLLQTFERYFITISVLVNNGSGVLTPVELEELCILYAQRISMLHEFDAPEFYDKTLFHQFIRNLSNAGVLTENEHGKLLFDKALETISDEAKLVMSTELRHGIIQIASG